MAASLVSLARDNDRIITGTALQQLKEFLDQSPSWRKTFNLYANQNSSSFRSNQITSSSPDFNSSLSERAFAAAGAAFLSAVIVNPLDVAKAAGVPYQNLHSKCRFEPNTGSIFEVVVFPNRIQSIIATGHLHQKVLAAFKESMRRRTVFSEIHLSSSPMVVLFSGGLDSMILAALLDQCLDSKYRFEIDMLNVSFDGELAPGRIFVMVGVKELWNLVEIDAEFSKLTMETKRVLSLIYPSNTYMDLNIVIALWLAAGGDGCVSEEINGNNNSKCGGYGRHRTKFRESSWGGLNEELKLDIPRIWKRNLGRDDRCIADNGKEARFPFLDENVIRILLDILPWEIADLGQPSGVGDKKILREVARMLHLNTTAVLPKRAIQFGSRIARESNRKNYGSNRVANQASAHLMFVVL
ncbi:hypothetical protein Lser_V15G37192 [Lactuca serriola]